MATLGQATKASELSSRLAMLDSLGTDRSEFITTGALAAAEEAVGFFIERVKKNMQERDLIVTGKIGDIRIETTAKSINIFGNSWLLYQDRGVNGREEKNYNTPHSYSSLMPPSYIFSDYIRTKNIQLRHNENYDPNGASPFADMDGEEKAIKQASYAMAMKIYKEGFKPQKFFAVEIPKLNEDLKKVITGFMITNIKQMIHAKASDQLFTGIN